jgi:hypothetical protein
MTKFILTDHATDGSKETLVTHAMNIMFWVAMVGQLLVVGVGPIERRDLIVWHQATIYRKSIRWVHQIGVLSVQPTARLSFLLLVDLLLVDLIR